jgi:cytochrome c-type biogenesis protein CcmE
MTRKQRRLTLIGLALGVLGLAAGLVLYALNDTIVFFHGPTDVVDKNIQPGTRFRIGGLVKQGSLVRGADLAVSFEVTDTNRSVPVSYKGILPDLFREGQGVVATGSFDTAGQFTAKQLLAKHDENYQPRELKPLEAGG